MADLYHLIKERQLSASGANIAGMNTFVVSLELSCVILRSIFCAVG